MADPKAFAVQPALVNFKRNYQYDVSHEAVRVTVAQHLFLDPNQKQPESCRTTIYAGAGLIYGLAEMANQPCDPATKEPSMTDEQAFEYCKCTKKHPMMTIKEHERLNR